MAELNTTEKARKIKSKESKQIKVFVKKLRWDCKGRAAPYGLFQQAFSTSFRPPFAKGGAGCGGAEPPRSFLFAVSFCQLFLCGYFSQRKSGERFKCTTSVEQFASLVPQTPSVAYRRQRLATARSHHGSLHIKRIFFINLFPIKQSVLILPQAPSVS